MENENIVELVRRFVPIADTAKRLGISRQSMYNYMNHYDSGDFEKIPANIMRFFDFVSDSSSKEDVEAYLMKINFDRVKVKEREAELSERVESIASKIKYIQTELKSEPSDSERIEDMRAYLNKLIIEKNALLYNLDITKGSDYDTFWIECDPASELPRRRKFWKGFENIDIRFGSVVKDGKAMIVFDAGEIEYSEIYCDVFMNDPESDNAVKIGRYYPEDYMNFIGVNNIPLDSMQFFYRLSVSYGDSFYESGVELLD